MVPCFLSVWSLHSICSNHTWSICSLSYDIVCDSPSRPVGPVELCIGLSDTSCYGRTVSQLKSSSQRQVMVLCFCKFRDVSHVGRYVYGCPPDRWTGLTVPSVGYNRRQDVPEYVNEYLCVLWAETCQTEWLRARQDHSMQEAAMAVGEGEFHPTGIWLIRQSA